MEVTIAISPDVFTAMQTECMDSMRTRFYKAHWTEQDQIIEEAKKMQLPAEFIKELRDDQRVGK